MIIGNFQNQIKNTSQYDSNFVNNINSLYSIGKLKIMIFLQYLEILKNIPFWWV